MSNEENTFRVRLSNDIKTVKKLLFLEELKSFLAAIWFATSVVYLAMLPFTFTSLLILFALWFCVRQFKPTIKKQIMYSKHIEFLSTIKNEKVWTQSDK